MTEQIQTAVAEATKRGKLRPNSVDSITGKNSGNNLGPGTPVVHFHQWEKNAIEVKLLLKGGGCENCNAQYAVPVELAHLGRADRNLAGGMVQHVGGASSEDAVALRIGVGAKPEQHLARVVDIDVFIDHHDVLGEHHLAHCPRPCMIL
jgi:tartrate dehydratase alpha subunit/fumarate hydratase class I-like protein